MKLLFCGDYFYDSKEREEDFEKIKSQFLEYDHVIVNYEGSLPTGKPVQKAVNLGMSEKSLDLPNNVVLSLANNHVFDFGEAGLNTTIEEINRRSLRYFGIESKKGACDNLINIEGDETRICLVAFGWKNEECKLSTKGKRGIVNFTKKNIDLAFSKNAVNGDFTIAYVHAGYEFEYYPLPLHVGLCRYLVNKGADFVVASHCHSIQPYEIYRGKHIFYGLGNLYFGSRRVLYPNVSDYGVALSINLDPETKAYKVKIRDVIYERTKDISKMLDDSHFLRKHHFAYRSITSYSAAYKQIRKRKKNPRPILYFDKEFDNSVKYLFWLFAVKVTGWLNIRQLVKKMLKWT
ncbi:CapA family protein [bacterium]|nr:CapA family protein [bacterium]